MRVVNEPDCAAFVEDGIVMEQMNYVATDMTYAEAIDMMRKRFPSLVLGVRRPFALR